MWAFLGKVVCILSAIYFLCIAIFKDHVIWTLSDIAELQAPNGAKPTDDVEDLWIVVPMAVIIILTFLTLFWSGFFSVLLILIFYTWTMYNLMLIARLRKETNWNYDPLSKIISKYGLISAAYFTLLGIFL